MNLRIGSPGRFQVPLQVHKCHLKVATERGLRFAKHQVLRARSQGLFHRIAQGLCGVAKLLSMVRGFFAVELGM